MQTVLTSAVVVVALAAAAWDVGARRIPNWISGPFLLLGAGRQAVMSGGRGLAVALAFGAGVLALLWHPWTRGRIGGGDVKLAVGAAVVVGWAHAGMFLAVSAIAGGAIALACYGLSSSAVRREVRTNLRLAATGHPLEAPAGARPGGGRVSVPYGVSFVVGVLACLCW